MTLTKFYSKLRKLTKSHPSWEWVDQWGDIRLQCDPTVNDICCPIEALGGDWLHPSRGKRLGLSKVNRQLIVDASDNRLNAHDVRMFWAGDYDMPLAYQPTRRYFKRVRTVRKQILKAVGLSK